MSHFHAVVWLDHSEAHVMHIAPDDVEKSVVHPAKPHQHLHSKSGVPGSGKAAEDKQYYHAVVEALKGAQEILVVGPAQAKLQLIKHMHAHDQAVADKVVGGLCPQVFCGQGQDAGHGLNEKRYHLNSVLCNKHGGLSQKWLKPFLFRLVFRVFGGKWN